MKAARPPGSAPGRSVARAVPRADGLRLADGDTGTLCVDSADCAPASMERFRCFNPFRFVPDLGLPVPGQSVSACSIESVWQGLKLVDGQTEFSMFTRPPYKRPSEQERQRPGYRYEEAVFLYGTDVVDLVTARYALYLPTYLYALDRLAPQAVIEEIDGALEAGRAVAFYDWDDNFVLTDPSRSFSHSAILAAWFNATLERMLVRPAIHWLQRQGLDLPESAFPTERYRKLHGIRS